MVKYAFNGFLFSQRQTGVMRFAKEILKEIDSICQSGEFVLVVPKYASHVPELKNIRVERYGSTKGSLWEQTDFFMYLTKFGCDSVNFNNTMPLLKPGVIVIHDLAYVQHPEYFDSLYGKISILYHRLIFSIASKSSKRIVTVSHFTKIQLVEQYKIVPSCIHVIGNAWQHFLDVSEDDEILVKNGLRAKEYYFSLGSVSKMKNTGWIIEEAKKNPNDTFVVSGAMPKNSNVTIQCPKNVIMTGFITDEQIKSLIKNCKAFIYPSLYDGFGIPPLEALSLHAKVICSTAACLPEIFRDSVYYIDPYETDINLDNLLKTKIGEPESTLERFSWQKSAKQFYKLLSEN
ncbi:MAG: glycosyltransferase family 1 protein [Eubacteriales bacterium]|nr:glycosyltransferase family 1 protein [Eubacteriales bacterium]